MGMTPVGPLVMGPMQENQVTFLDRLSRCLYSIAILAIQT